MIDNQIIVYLLFVIVSLSVISSFVRIFFPHYHLKKYVSGKWGMPSDNWSRFVGFIWLFPLGYIIAYLLGYIK